MKWKKIFFFSKKKRKEKKHFHLIAFFCLLSHSLSRSLSSYTFYSFHFKGIKDVSTSLSHSLSHSLSFSIIPNSTLRFILNWLECNIFVCIWMRRQVFFLQQLTDRRRRQRRHNIRKVDYTNRKILFTIERRGEKEENVAAKKKERKKIGEKGKFLLEDERRHTQIYTHTTRRCLHFWTEQATYLFRIWHSARFCYSKVVITGTREVFHMKFKQLKKNEKHHKNEKVFCFFLLHFLHTCAESLV